MLDNDIADQLRRAQALLRRIETFSHSGSWEIDRKGRFTYWSDQMSHLHGYPLAHPPKTIDDWLGTIRDDERIAFNSQIERVLSGEADRLEVEYSWPGADYGKNHRFRTIADPVVQDKAIVGLRAVVNKIGSQSETRENENRYSVFLRSLPAPIAIWRREDNDFILAETNDALNVLSEGRSAELVGQPASRIFADRRDMLEDMHACFASNTLISREIKNRTMFNGLSRDYNTNFIRVGDELIIFSVDITARKKIEELLHENERQYRDLFEHSHEGLCVVDGERRIKTANSTLLDALGYQSSELRNRLFLDIVDDAYRSRAKEYVSTTLGSILPRELSLIRKDGTSLFVLISIRTIGDEKHLQGSLIEITDITSLKQTERNMIRLQRELEEAQSEGDKKEAALEAVLTHLESEKSNYRKKVHHRFYRAINPYLERLKANESLSETDVKEMEEAVLVSLDHDVDDYEVHKSSLSPKEQLICSDIADGLTSKEIGKKMYLSVETVRKHRKSIRRKLKLTNRGANLTTYLRQRMKSED